MYQALRSSMRAMRHRGCSGRASVRAYRAECAVVSTSDVVPSAPHIDLSHSFQLDNLADAFCSVSVTRKLPGCEHEATMRCSDNPRHFSCESKCAGVMSCCGRSCNAQCHQCQVLNGPQGHDEEASPDPPAITERSNHVAHPCQRSLFCGHLCGKACSQVHECTVFCKGPCRQVCVHARCRSDCSKPCAPCQEPCTWYVLG